MYLNLSFHLQAKRSMMLSIRILATRTPTTIMMMFDDHDCVVGGGSGYDFYDSAADFCDDGDNDNIDGDREEEDDDHHYDNHDNF